MKNLIIIYFSLFLVLPLFGFGQDFELIEVKRNIEQDTIKIYPIFENYQLGDYCFAIGHDPKSVDKFGLKLLVFDKNANLIFKSDAQEDNMTFTLKFFESKVNPNEILIFGHQSNEYSWGNQVYRFEKGRIKYLGLLDIATHDQFDVPWDISTHTEIRKVGKNLRFDFVKDTLVFNPGGRKESLVESEKIYYLWDGEKMVSKNNQ
ncbi:hypothetical protein [Flagellimonas onchidii]|uniref:hypothetical protein n=1 Tax=Flagellimonas onchidii TaxID=2562684 RepID=UPI0010A6459A|nr:hypothetical protein [Allomuricauda onchidii]